MPQSTIQSINTFLDLNDKNLDKSFTMYEYYNDSKNRLYIVNQYQKKLLQFIVNNEQDSRNTLTYAQIKMIPYALQKAKVYDDTLNDPKYYRIKNMEITYHGGAKGKENPKIHLKINSLSSNRYKTLVHNSLELDSALPRLVPVCSLLPGYEYENPKTGQIKKNSHIFQIHSNKPVQLDFYISGKNFDLKEYVNSIYSLNMFFSLDYLIKKENSPFQGMPIVQPITGFRMGNYYLWIKCSQSDYTGKPHLQFYNNIDYYDKVMNRRIAYINENYTIKYITMLDKEKES